MMKSVNLALKENSYQIVIGNNILPLLGSKLKALRVGKDALIITNPEINRLYGKKVIRGLKNNGFTVKVFKVPDGEESKSAKTAFDLFEGIAKYDVYKSCFVIALGGGVIGDLAGYIASSYKRGIPYAQVPTTFLAQIDSAIGGKVAIDLSVGKNLVGAFYQPKIVWSDVGALTTVPPRQIKNGLAEAVKYGIIADEKLFYYIKANLEKLLNVKPNPLLNVILSCSRIKAGIVAKDEKDSKGPRALLNFGHTLGHAIETAFGYSRYQHGEAVALGMRIACRISVLLKMLRSEDERVINALLSDIGLPSKLESCDINKLLLIMRHDKKFIGSKNRLILATRIGKAKIVEGVPEAIIKDAVKAYL
ncbi:MAG: 3-dehydroquinate synthase [Candidatus Omnitrophica bacterium]|nr:3-dehydroquinate synthase [Candidatus Omnitrophota bacterium]